MEILFFFKEIFHLELIVLALATQSWTMSGKLLDVKIAFQTTVI